MKFSKLSLFCLAIFAFSDKSQADLSMVILESEPIFPMSIFLNQGHTVTYITDRCPRLSDSSPEGRIKIAKCNPGEPQGVVINHHTGLGKENYDWFISRPSTFFYGVDQPHLTPLITNKKVKNLAEQSSFVTQEFQKAIRLGPDGKPPKGFIEGEWITNVAQVYTREAYAFTMKVSQEQEDMIVDRLNKDPNTSKFDLIFNNCSDPSEFWLNYIFPDFSHTMMSKASGLGFMATPKGVAQDIVSYAEKHPEVELNISKVTEIPGTFPRSVDVIYPLENTYMSVWTPAILGFQSHTWNLLQLSTMHGLLWVTMGSLVFHQVINRFDIPHAYLEYVSPQTVEAARKLREKRQEQDEARIAFNTAYHGEDKLRYANKLSKIVDELSVLSKDPQLKREEILGTDTQWNSYEVKFDKVWRAVKNRRDLPQEVRELLADEIKPWPIAKKLLKLFEEKGEFKEVNGNMEMTIQFAGEEKIRKSGITVSTVDDEVNNDEVLASLIMLAHVAYDLDAKQKDRPTLGNFELFWDQMMLFFSRVHFAID